jgi:hypothetical protein
MRPWICGDCHVGNLGPLDDAKGHVVVQIRDLDQTVIGNPAHDLIRLGLSLASAARGSDLPGVTTARILEELVAGYQSSLLSNFDTEKDKSHRPKSIQTLLAQLVGQVLDPGRPELAGQESESTTGAEVSSLRAGAVGTKHGSWKGERWARTHMPIFVLMLAANLFVRSKRERSSGDKVVEEALFRRGIFKLDVTPLRIIAG